MRSHLKAGRRSALLVVLLGIFGCGAEGADPGDLTHAVADDPAASGSYFPQDEWSPEAVEPPVQEQELDLHGEEDLPAPIAVPVSPELCTPPAGCEDLPIKPSSLRYPLVFAHGMAGFDSFGALEYWGGAPGAVDGAGVGAYVAVVDPLNGSDLRGGQLAQFIDRVLECTCSTKVNIIAHSQGGIDSRVVVNMMGYGDRVASVTTIATPHRGSPVADAVLDVAPDQVWQLGNLIGWFVTEIYTDPKNQTALRESLKWLSEKHLAAFEQEYPTDNRVAWYSYGGRAGLTASGTPDCDGAELGNPSQHTPITGALLPSWTFMGGLMGVSNDGLVTVKSAKWGHFRGCIPADHMQEIGLGLPQGGFDHHAFYIKHAAFLAKQDF